MSDPLRYIGLMSGTSMDGIDAGLLVIDDDGMRLEHGITLPYPVTVHNRLTALIDNSEHVSLDEPMRERGGLIDAWRRAHPRELFVQPGIDGGPDQIRARIRSHVTS